MNLKVSSVCGVLKPLMVQLVREDIGLISLADVQFGDFSTGRQAIDYTSSLPVKHGRDVVDRFQLRLPYAGKCLSWDVVMNSLSPDHPPDFDFNDEQFMNAVTIDWLEKYVPSLMNWNPNDVHSLKNIISEFISLYKKYQFDLLKDDNYCWFEYTALIKSNIVSEDDVEVLVSNNGYVNFLIRLCPDLVDYRVPRNNEVPEQYAAHVSVTFNVNAGNKIIKPVIIYLPLLEDCFINKSPIINDECLSLADYLIKINRRVEDSLSPSLLNANGKRKKFVFEWLSMLGTKVIEYDALEFHSVSFLLEVDGFLCILSINLPSNFTRFPPEYRLQSVYSPKPLVTFIEDIPYQPNWAFKHMVNRASEVIESKLSSFKRTCKNNI